MSRGTSPETGSKRRFASFGQPLQPEGPERASFLQFCESLVDRMEQCLVAKPGCNGERSRGESMGLDREAGNRARPGRGSDGVDHDATERLLLERCPHPILVVVGPKLEPGQARSQKIEVDVGV